MRKEEEIAAIDDRLEEWQHLLKIFSDSVSGDKLEVQLEVAAAVAV